MSPAKIVIVVAAIARIGAASDGVARSWRSLVGDGRWRVTLIATKNDLPGLPARIVPGLPELLLDPRFLAADLLIYHVSGWHPVHDALLLGNGRASQAAFLHAVPEAEPALRQVNNLRRADRIWPVGEAAAGLLTRLDFDPSRIAALPSAASELRVQAAQLLFGDAAR